MCVFYSSCEFIQPSKAGVAHPISKGPSSSTLSFAGCTLLSQVHCSMKATVEMNNGYILIKLFMVTEI